MVHVRVSECPGVRVPGVRKSRCRGVTKSPSQGVRESGSHVKSQVKASGNSYDFRGEVKLRRVVKRRSNAVPGVV